MRLLLIGVPVVQKSKSLVFFLQPVHKFSTYSFSDECLTMRFKTIYFSGCCERQNYDKNSLV